MSIQIQDDLEIPPECCTTANLNHISNPVKYYTSSNLWTSLSGVSVDFGNIIIVRFGCLCFSCHVRHRFRCHSECVFYFFRCFLNRFCFPGLGLDIRRCVLVGCLLWCWRRGFFLSQFCLFWFAFFWLGKPVGFWASDSESNQRAGRCLRLPASLWLRRR